jgi:hypothetical protein
LNLFRNGPQDENGSWVYQIEPAFQELTEKISNVVLYEHFSETLRYTVHRFRESGSLEVVDLRFVLRKILRLSNVEWKTNPNYLSGNCRSRLSYQCQLCQRIVRNYLEDSVTAERYWNNIFDVFINQLHDDGYFQQDGATAHTARELYEASLLGVIF